MSKQAIRSSWLTAYAAAVILGTAVACHAAWAGEPECQCPRACPSGATSAEVPLLTKLPYVHRLFRSVGIGSNCPAGECCETIGIDVDWIVVKDPQTACTSCNKKCGTGGTAATSAPATEPACPAATSAETKCNASAYTQCKCAGDATATTVSTAANTCCTKSCSATASTAKACTATACPCVTSAVATAAGKCCKAECEARFAAAAKCCPTEATTAVSTGACGGKCCQEACKSGEVAIIAPAGQCHLTGTCPANVIPEAIAARAAGCSCPENCTATSCATSHCSAAAQCAQLRGELPLFVGGGAVCGISPLMGFPLPHPAPFEALPGPAELFHALHESQMSAMEAILEAREESHAKQLEMLEEIGEMQSEALEAVAEAGIEKAKLEGRLEAQKAQSELFSEMHKLLVENARLKAQTELASQREELMREALQLALENERLKHRVAELEQLHAGDAARTATGTDSTSARR